ncbi:DENN domain-containing protein 3 [Heterocephalus glaber]|uniref:DENN domain-containing protein 3 n=1 Tax=Heterocephalus glaber TaxID=10181 RepID=G5C8Y9_HETGA|nr:DENN domain-containing protein 3 [Heterocephalus glaber]
MAEATQQHLSLPSGLLELCALLGAPRDSLRSLEQFTQKRGVRSLSFLDPEVLSVFVPPFISKEDSQGAGGNCATLGKGRRRSFRKKREKPKTEPWKGPPGDSKGPDTEDISIPGGVDLLALPQLCFPGGMHVASEPKEDHVHFLVLTDVCGNRTYGVVAQYYRPLHVVGAAGCFVPFAVCVVSRFPYYNSLKDCLSCLLTHLKLCKDFEVDSHIKDFAARLSLIPSPPPGPLHLMFNMKPLHIVFPSRADPESPVIDLDLHLPLLCFRPEKVLQILSCLLTEQRIVFFSSDWALLTLIAECFRVYLHPLQWQHTFVPILSGQMLDFVMAPTSFLMGCHLDHFEEVSKEADGLILIDIDHGSITCSRSSDNDMDIPDIPLLVAQMFIQRVQSLQLHPELHLAHLSSSTDLNEGRARQRAWQQTLNSRIQHITLQLLVGIFREVKNHLNYEHRVFNSEEFLKTRATGEQQFYKQHHQLSAALPSSFHLSAVFLAFLLLYVPRAPLFVRILWELQPPECGSTGAAVQPAVPQLTVQVLDTYMFHSFLKARLSRRMDAYAHMDLDTQSEEDRIRGMLISPRRPTVEKMASRNLNATHRRMVVSMPSLQDITLPELPPRNASLRIMDTTACRTSSPVLNVAPKSTYMFKIPEIHFPLVSQCIQAYHSNFVTLLSKAMSLLGPDNSLLLARYFYLRGLVHLTQGQLLSALSDFQNLYKTDIQIFPADLVKGTVESMSASERAQAERTPELRRLITEVLDKPGEAAKADDAVKHFELPKKHMQLEDFVKRVQESGIVKDTNIIHRLFDALTVGQQKLIDPETFRDFYNCWKETEAEAQEVSLPSLVMEHLDKNECVYKLSSSVKTNRGVGKIAMTQKRLFLLTEGRPGYVEISTFRNIEEVRSTTVAFLLLRIPTLKIKMTSKKEVFEANLKSECDLWHLMVKEMWAGKKLADDHKDPQYVQQALTNVLLMDAVVGTLQSPGAIYAASKLSYFDKMKNEMPMAVPKTTSETLKHKINPSAGETGPQAIDVLLYTPGHLDPAEKVEDAHPKLWCALSEGRVIVFDASSWTIHQHCFKVGTSKVNCMVMAEQSQVWVGSEDSIIYIINVHSMSCNKQLTDHRAAITGLIVHDGKKPSEVYSCSLDGTVLAWNVSTLRVTCHFQLPCCGLTSISLHSSSLWCCAGSSIVVVTTHGFLCQELRIDEDLREAKTSFLGLQLLPEQGQLWTTCAGSGEVYIWSLQDLAQAPQRIHLQDCSEVSCMIRVKRQVWVGGKGLSQGRPQGKIYVIDVERKTVEKELVAEFGGALVWVGGKGLSQGRPQGKIYVIDVERKTVEKELVAHADTVRTLCSAEDRYVLSGSGREEGKIAIWKVE